MVGSQAANPDNLDYSKEAGGEAQVTQGIVEIMCPIVASDQRFS